MRDQLSAYLQDKPVTKKRLLFMRADYAPIQLIQNKFRAHVLTKLLSHKDADEILKQMQILVQQHQEEAGDSGITAQLEVDPASLA